MNGSASPAPDRAHEIARQLKAWSIEAGFDLAGVASVRPGLGIDRLDSWLAEGRQGDMSYMARHRDIRSDPTKLLDGAQSILMVGLVYRTKPAEIGPARISCYAWGEDYHDVIRRKLKQVADKLKTAYPDIRSRVVVDSAPLMERDYARLAGLGWFGKNTLLLSRQHGSWFFLGALLVDEHLAEDAPMESDHCGSCQRCLDACPTQAFLGPYDLDPRRCISYLTIEHHAAIDGELAEKMGHWVYGCDVCQEVCPWNDHAERHGRIANEEFLPRSGRNPASMEQLLSLDDESFAEAFASSAIKRIGRDRLVRQAVIAAANTGDRHWLGSIRPLLTDSSDLVRDAAKWACRRLGGDDDAKVG